VTGRAAVAVCSIVFAAGCATDSSDTPSTGPGGGSVEVRPSVEPMPGATVTLSLSAEEANTGSACTTLDEWVDDTWQARWYWERPSPTPVPIPAGEERTCPAIGIPLPAEQTVVVPDELPVGTWRFGYVAGDDDLGAYVFEVG
jgi:hypothetical protein